MKISRNKLILAIILIIVLIGLIVFKIVSNKQEETLKESSKCDSKNFFVTSYSSADEEVKTYFIKSEKDYDKIKNEIHFSDEEKLDFKNNDYLIYMLPAQHGCNRTYELKCFEQRDKELFLDFNKNEVDDMCDAIFNDSIIIELEKDKYNKNIKVNSNI